MSNHLIIFVRAPRLGRVKRRLATRIGDMAALRFHRLAADSLIRRLARDRRWQTVLAVTPEGYHWPPRVMKLRQVQGDVGHRMATALRAMPRGPALIVGSDIPAIAPDHIARAFRALRGHDAVFGPAADGGYWLVGLRNPALLPGLFSDVRWSTEFALADTIANLPLGRRHALMEVLEDVDDISAYRRWCDAG